MQTQSSKVILLVEDNADDVELTVRAFKKSPVKSRLVIARSGIEALDYLFATDANVHDHATPPYVILLDLKLPKFDGFEVLKRIRADDRTKLIPVVVLTSSKEAIDISGSYNLGANSYIRKPVDFGQFVETARYLSQYWLKLNEPSSSMV